MRALGLSAGDLLDWCRIVHGAALLNARTAARLEDGQREIVEGYLDVIAVHQAGYENVISPMGTALTEDQIRLLKKFTRKIVLALDPDAAGQKAVLRGLDAARASMDREEELGFDARGLLRHEARLQADLRVAGMPDGLDPDEIVARNPQEWAALIAGAKPVVEHVLDTLTIGKDINDPKVKREVASQILPLIEDLPDPLERDSYRQMLARRLKVDERSLTVAGPAVTTSRRRPSACRPGPMAPDVPGDRHGRVSQPKRGRNLAKQTLLQRPGVARFPVQTPQAKALEISAARPATTG